MERNADPACDFVAHPTSMVTYPAIEVGTLIYADPCEYAVLMTYVAKRAHAPERTGPG